MQGGELKKSEEELYLDWLDAICDGEEEKIKPEDVLYCVRQINSIFNLVNN